ncbi:hypothetical protein POM88_019571 [Heracleum sosnowskyi]|uniref:Myosin N-terminal SH3-like domain-containing protein n=1 Tax=Heracleum sosnowskyi TaxID=360622 RepID=A0AAD8GTM4_9APIA|nr:hypothetical protein POM88_048313 [Heracleum sosnowskyi]KAK1381836.1 hypothetical protein POM88_019571 [Heracleum sosnowskyi]
MRDTKYSKYTQFISSFPSLVASHVHGTSVNIIVGTHVWVEDPKVAWIDGQVTKITGKDVEIETTNGKKPPRDAWFYSAIKLQMQHVDEVQGIVEFIQATKRVKISWW